LLLLPFVVNKDLSIYWNDIVKSASVYESRPIAKTTPTVISNLITIGAVLGSADRNNS